MTLRFQQSDIEQAAAQFVAAMGDRTIFAFHGGMGAGKTTFIQAVCRCLGITEPITSPTFAIVNEYRTEHGTSVFHFDFYRIKRLSEAYDIGCEEYFYSGSPCFIEWPELIEEILPEETVHISISELPDGSREVCEME